MNNFDNFVCGILFKESTGKHKVGEIVYFDSIPADQFIFEFDTDKQNPFSHILDPTSGGGGQELDIKPEKELSKWKKANKDVTTLPSYVLQLFVPKSKTLQGLARKLTAAKSKATNRFLMSPAVKREIYEIEDEINEEAKVLGLVRTTERYKIIVDDRVYESLPDGVIGSTEYDYSFHGGEGEIGSWLMSYGANKEDVTNKLKAGLKKAKFQYVGNAMELRYNQRNAIGRSE